MSFLSNFSATSNKSYGSQKFKSEIQSYLFDKTIWNKKKINEFIKKNRIKPPHEKGNGEDGE